ncbi:hypothetical protein [Nonomuraea aurantiaca]|uniref:hypothetical protein n=1 Tax=Nonomuraea aurantiaca TaxID=2878562 RepID=UPI001CD94873|nr:hypothetical protein [Nonomuraea aurantiaca]MCA2225882.1 hypothetical protein [Nonomuraea aurantiaca]
MTVQSIRARTGAPAKHGRYPLVVLSPGLGLPRAGLTFLAEDLASRAYVRAFFDLHLKGKKQPLLNGPSLVSPEVTFPNP